MRDIAVALLFVAAVLLAFRKPWTGALSLSVSSYLNPHAYAWGFMVTFPIYQALFIAVAISFLMTKDRSPVPKDWRVKLFVILWLYFLFTTMFAMVPVFSQL